MHVYLFVWQKHIELNTFSKRKMNVDTICTRLSVLFEFSRFFLLFFVTFDQIRCAKIFRTHRFGNNPSFVCPISLNISLSLSLSWPNGTKWYKLCQGSFNVRTLVGCLTGLSNNTSFHSETVLLFTFILWWVSYLVHIGILLCVNFVFAA